MSDSSFFPDPSALPLADEERIDQLGNDFERAWKAGSRPRVEDYLHQMPPPARGVLLMELLALEVELRSRHGDQVDHAEYRRRFSGEADSAAVLAALDLVFQRAAREPPETYRHASRRDREKRDERQADHPDIAAPEKLLESIPGYDLHEEIGRGGFGNVLRATRRASTSPRTIRVTKPIAASSQMAKVSRWRLWLIRLTGPDVLIVVSALIAVSRDAIGTASGRPARGTSLVGIFFRCTKSARALNISASARQVIHLRARCRSGGGGVLQEASRKIP